MVFAVPYTRWCGQNGSSSMKTFHHARHACNTTCNGYFAEITQSIHRKSPVGKFCSSAIRIPQFSNTYPRPRLPEPWNQPMRDLFNRSLLTIGTAANLCHGQTLHQSSHPRRLGLHDDIANPPAHDLSLRHPLITIARHVATLYFTWNYVHMRRLEVGPCG